ncbi:hypothetical protein BSL78_06842 [Apostichopus japonicus]|uniref:Retrovirus-related Pol polyprotein from transposon n=1 Tax=Stichopus japonicus TaxID=307972 RepID=A0A2G8L7L1_STIJA|nr:hypothetical protein BSL78_06842 [Apostichopus japonicus]
MFGRDPILPVDILLNNTGSDDQQHNTEDEVTRWVASHSDVLKMAFRQAGERLALEASARKARYDKFTKEHPLSLGTRVYLKSHPPGRHKIADEWGQVIYTVTARPGDGATYKIKQADGTGISKTVHRREIRPCPMITPAKSTNRPARRRPHVSAPSSSSDDAPSTGSESDEDPNHSEPADDVWNDSLTSDRRRRSTRRPEESTPTFIELQRASSP